MLLTFFISSTVFLLMLELLSSLLSDATFDLTDLSFLFFSVAVDFCFMICVSFFENRSLLFFDDSHLIIID